MQSDDFLRNAMKPFPHWENVDNYRPPSSSRGPTAADYTVLAVHGGKLRLRLSHPFQDELRNLLRNRLLVTPVGESVSAPAQGWAYTSGASTAAFEKSLESLMIAIHCPLVRLFMTETQRLSSTRFKLVYLRQYDVDFEKGRFYQPGGCNRLSSSECQSWSDAAHRLARLPALGPNDDGHAFVANRNQFPPVPLPHTARLPCRLSDRAGLADIVYSLPIDNRPARLLFVVEVKLHTVLDSEEFHRLQDSLLRNDDEAWLSLAVGRGGDIGIYTELYYKWKSVIAQVFTELCASKTRVALITNGKMSVVVEYVNGGLRMSSTIDHNISEDEGGLSFLQLLVALTLYVSRSWYNRDLYPKPTTP